MRLLCGDALDLAGTLAPRSVQAVVSSPPYFRQREYSADARELGTRGQALDEYVDYLVELFRRLRPALDNHAAIWLDLGNRFAGGGFGREGRGMRPRKSWNGMVGPSHRQVAPDGYRDRDLLPLPALVADALRA